MPLVIVDAENVRRSLWPKLSLEELVARARAWAAREGHDLLIVFDGPAPEEAPDLVGSRYADDEIVRLANEAQGPVWSSPRTVGWGSASPAVSVASSAAARSPGICKRASI